MYTREELETKTNFELRQMALDMGITGMSKKRKSVIIDSILAVQGTSTASVENVSVAEEPVQAKKLTGVEFNAVSKLSNPDAGRGKKTTTWCRISSGATSQQFDVAGYSVGEVMEFMAEVLNVEKMSDIIVNGNKVEASYIIQAGDNIEFIKPAGKKG